MAAVSGYLERRQQALLWSTLQHHLQDEALAISTSASTHLTALYFVQKVRLGHAGVD